VNHIEMNLVLIFLKNVKLELKNILNRIMIKNFTLSNPNPHLCGWERSYLNLEGATR